MQKNFNPFLVILLLALIAAESYLIYMIKVNNTIQSNSVCPMVFVNPKTCRLTP